MSEPRFVVQTNSLYALDAPNRAFEVAERDAQADVHPCLPRAHFVEALNCVIGGRVKPPEVDGRDAGRFTDVRAERKEYRFTPILAHVLPSRIGFPLRPQQAVLVAELHERNRVLGTEYVEEGTRVHAFVGGETLAKLEPFLV